MNSSKIAFQRVMQLARVYCQAKRSVNREKAKHWRTNRDSYLAGMDKNAGQCHFLSSSRRSDPTKSRIGRKTTDGKSGKREPWKLTVHELMMEEFDRLRAARVKVTRNVISEIAIDFALAGTITGLPNLPVLLNVTKCFIHDFCMRRSLV